MLQLLSTVDRYQHSTITNPSLAFPHLVVSWASLFFIAYKVARRLLTPTAPYSLPFLPLTASPQSVEEWANRTVSIVHALLACCGCVHWVIAEKHLLVRPEDYGYLRSNVCDFYLGVTLGYLLFDLLRLCYYRFLVLANQSLTSAPVTSMFIHHAVIIVAYYLGVTYHYGTFYMGLLLNNEITTPFLNVRFLMAERGWKTGNAYKLNEAAFVIGFFISRVLGNIWILWHMQTHLRYFAPVATNQGLPIPIFYLLPVLAYAHGALQFYWFALLMRMVYRKITYGQRTTGPPSGDAVMKSDLVSQPGSEKVLVFDPPVAPNVKSSKLLGLPPAGVTGKAIRKLGLVEVANEKAAEVLGLRTTPPLSRRKRQSSSD
ncbi:uncharacterized protein SPPG_00655 [Spizellomyces punctatus DAOM BR117]|uniref:TLC domain-containing protein n=1 Tax=Spizellomyces punctatus (strain DAOM BR117) TaxID=645134 RepID=A0A0L0HV28_SPIPD|nr:uncharacterized protein SPPG_00655 [Spizellomyces punctatus DAOM BR117]KND04968.1 hypothetical protein SPPG_00655 [Spizellomyces punctatus DAOM BR117]|eukprot:XP_016613007.1 hypothetical protein SPPG_00655 [Spizellomyces punctatus DAOM BR117]